MKHSLWQQLFTTINETYWKYLFQDVTNLLLLLLFAIRMVKYLS
jgi:hypothetical protein